MTKRLEKDWNGNLMKNALNFELESSLDSLIFAVKFDSKTQDHPLSQLGRFQAELWKYDVAELFISNPESGEYLEINLNVTGAWWLMKFQDVLKRDGDFQEEEAKRSVRVTKVEEGNLEGGVRFELNRSYIKQSLGLDLEALHGNVTAISSAPNRVFSSAVKLTAEKPDCHRPEEFTPLKNLFT